MANKIKEYVNKEDFHRALVDFKEKEKEHKEKNLPPPAINNYLGDCWMKIAEGLSHNYRFINYTYREEMIGDGIENCLRYFRNYDPVKYKNPFGYFTQIIYFAFVRRIEDEKDALYVKYKSTQQMGILDEMELLELEDGTTKQFELYENIAEFIEKYETAKAKKKMEKMVKKPKGLENFLNE